MYHEALTIKTGVRGCVISDTCEEIAPFEFNNTHPFTVTTLR